MEEYNPLHPEDGGNKVLRNVGILQQHYTASEPRRLRLLLIWWRFTAVEVINVMKGIDFPQPSKYASGLVISSGLKQKSVAL
jgi:hypothetical protein